MLILAFVACSKSPAPVEPSAEPARVPVEGMVKPDKPPAKPSTPDAATLIRGDFVSSACEGRDYVRELTLADGRFEARDLVSPCPEGSTCVWSGIVTRKGDAMLDSGKIVLVDDKAPDTRAAALPASLAITATGLAAPDTDCVYAKP